MMPEYRLLRTMCLLAALALGVSGASSAVIVAYESSSITLTDGDAQPSGDPVSLVVDAALTGDPVQDQITFVEANRKMFHSDLQGELGLSQITNSLLQRAVWPLPVATFEVFVHVNLYSDGNFDVSTDFIRKSSITQQTLAGDLLTTRYMQILAANFGGGDSGNLFDSTNVLTLALVEELAGLANWTSHFYFEELVNEIAHGSVLDDTLTFVEDDTGLMTLRVGSLEPSVSVPLPGSLALSALALTILATRRRDGVTRRTSGA